MGCGIYHEQTDCSQSWRITDHSSVFTAELVAIIKAMIYAITNNIQGEVAILTDSLSSCDAIGAGVRPSKRPDLIDAIEELNKTAHNKTPATHFTIIWIPGHIDIKGNERADLAAKKGANQNEISLITKLGYQETKAVIKTKIIDPLFQQEWEEDTLPSTIFMRKIIPQIKTNISYKSTETSINRLRASRAIFALKKDRFCLRCKTLLTINHTILHCKNFQEIRTKIKDQLYKENRQFNKENILAINTSSKAKALVNKLIYDIDNLFGI